MLKRLVISLIIICILAAGVWYGYQKIFGTKYMSTRIPSALVDASTSTQPVS